MFPYVLAFRHTLLRLTPGTVGLCLYALALRLPCLTMLIDVLNEISLGRLAEHTVFENLPELGFGDFPPA